MWNIIPATPEENLAAGGIRVSVRFGRNQTLNLEKFFKEIQEAKEKSNQCI
jgi:hypothetical protein